VHRPHDLLDAQISVPFADLGRAHRSLKERLLADFSTLIDEGDFINGRAVGEFEQKFAAYCGTSLCVGVGSGLDAIRLALLAGGIEPGDEVVVPANTFVATFEAVTQAGAVPVVVDVTEVDYNIDVAAAETAITQRTRVLLPVHLYGQMADMRPLQQVALRHSIRIVEDACQAHGAARDGLRAGAVGNAGAFSFYPTKNLGALGDAGAVVSNDVALADRVRALREHGQRVKNNHEFEGFTARLDTIQALALLQKLPLLDRWNEQRADAASFYGNGLNGVGDLGLPPTAVGSSPVWYAYVVRTSEPEQLAEFLARRGIATGRHYPQPAHLSPAFSWLGHRRGSFPVAERLAGELLSLPIFPGISERELEAVVEAVSEFFRQA
jgi:dTDP-4-amino-4,6-dideoxygalactose transaminase